MPRALTRSRSAARAAAVPFLPTARSRTRRGGLRRPAHGGPPVPPQGRPPPFFCPQREAERGGVVGAPQRPAAPPPLEGADPPPRWPLRRLVQGVRERFGLRCCRETIRAVLHRRKLSWKKAKKLLGRADPERRQAFLAQLQSVLEGAQRDRHLVVYVDEAHIHQDADLGYGWAERGQRFWGSPQARRACRRASRSMGCISTTRARCGGGLSRAPPANTRSRYCGGCGPRSPMKR